MWAASLLDAMGSVFERRPGQGVWAFARSVSCRLGMFALIPAAAVVAAALLSGSPWWVQLGLFALAAGSLGLAALVLFMHALKAVGRAIRRRPGHGGSIPNMRAENPEGNAHA